MDPGQVNAMDIMRGAGETCAFQTLIILISTSIWWYRKGRAFVAGEFKRQSTFSVELLSWNAVQTSIAFELKPLDAWE